MCPGHPSGSSPWSSKRSLKEGSKVLVVDDFMKAGGTINGMKNLLDEFSATLSGIGVLVESNSMDDRLVDDYVSLLKLSNVNEKTNRFP